MLRLVAILIGVLLFAASPAGAQNSDPFKEVAPPAPPTPGQDPFEMAPAASAPPPAPAPKPAPPRPRPAREPEPEPAAAAPTPPPPAPPPAPNAKCFTFGNKQFCE